MVKEIIVNAGEMESRVAILENGRLMELHVERDPKIVGNIYKGRVTKVLKGMDAAFVDIGVERNAFLAVSDVVPQDEDDEGSGGGGRPNRHNLPPITQLLHANQEILVQVVRAPMGTKGARITTRLSLPGRYMVLMLNSGSYIGVSRKIDDPKERQRLRAIANELRPENYSLIVRTEAENRTEEELQQDLHFLMDMAGRIEAKAGHSPVPSLIHGDLTLIFRLIRDAFTRDVSRVVVDSPSAYENVLELVGLIAPRMKNRVFLYNEALPIFHAYNIEPEIERALRRRVWLPSGGSLVVDQAEALTAIDVNTGRFVGSVELAETVLTTNLQAAEEVARQLRLRDLGGIIVVDFIDMDNPKHRQQVIKAFEDALKRDRAKIKVHNISALGLVEMTRKRTGESVGNLLTEPCPYCSGIGRIQNPLTMALRIEREIAAMAVEHRHAEALCVTAHPRVIASMLGYEGEAQRDLEAYIERPIYLRAEEHYHPNTYRLERLTLEQALVAVPHLEEGDVVEGQVVNPDPELSLSPLLMTQGIFLIVPDLDAPVGARVKVRVREVGTSLAIADPLAEELRCVRAGERVLPSARPPLVPEALLPPYLREERAATPPRELPLLSPSAEGVTMPEPLPLAEIIAQAEEEQPVTAEQESSADRRRRRSRRRRPGRGEPVAAGEETLAPPVEEAEAEVEAPVVEEALPAETPGMEPVEQLSPSARRRRRRRRARTQQAATSPVAEAMEEEGVPEVDEIVTLEAAELPEAVPVAETEAAPVATTEEEARPRRRRRSSRRRVSEAAVAEELPLETPPLEPVPLPEPIAVPEVSPEAIQKLVSLLTAPETEEVPPAEATPEEPEAAVAAEAVAPEEAEAAPARKPRRRRAPRTAPVEAPVAEEAPVVPEEVPAPEAAASLEAPEAIKAAEIPVPEEAPAEEKPKRRRAATRRTPRAKKTEEAPETPTEE